MKILYKILIIYSSIMLFLTMILSIKTHYDLIKTKPALELNVKNVQDIIKHDSLVNSMFKMTFEIDTVKLNLARETNRIAKENNKILKQILKSLKK